MTDQDETKPSPDKPVPADASIADLDADVTAAADMKAAEPIDELVQGTPDERTEAQARAETCALELQAVLGAHRCRIMPRIDPNKIEPVGLAGDKIQITATFYIAPLP